MMVCAEIEKMQETRLQGLFLNQLLTQVFHTYLNTYIKHILTTVWL